MKVFISHSSQNRRRAARLAKALQELNVDVWYDEWEILVGYNLADQIYDGIRSSDFMLILLTKSSVTSKWVKEEMDFAKTAEIESGGTIIVPLLYEDCDIPAALKAKVYADFRGPFERGFNQLARLLSTSQPPSTLVDPMDARYEIELPLHSYGLVGDLIFHGMACLEKPATKGKKAKANEASLQGFKHAVELLSSFAQHLKVDRRCYAWLDELLSMFQDADVLENWEEHRHVVFDFWMKGVTLYRGGVAQKLSLNARVAYEIGGRLRRIDSREKWIADFRSAYEELQFSDRFYKLVTRKNASIERITDALILELGSLHDYGRLRIFHQKRIRADGIWSGFNCVLVFLFLAEPEEGAAKFIAFLSRSAEYVLAELSDFDVCEYMLEVAIEVWRDIGQGNYKVGDRIVRMYVRLLEAARLWAQTSVAGKAFLLGLQLGICLFEKKVVVAKFLHQIEVLAIQLGVSDTMLHQLRTVLHDLFFDYKQGVKLLLPLVTDLANSFRDKNMEVETINST
jgi:hypothetical protein